MTADTKTPPVSDHYQLVDPPQPKPSDRAIKTMQALYYSELSAGFDKFNNEVSFGTYLSAINSRVAAELRQTSAVGELLSVGVGTGSREVAITKLSGLELNITGVDISPEMCKLASDNGIKTFCGVLNGVNLPADHFDACLFLNAFEVLTSYAERLSYLNVIHRCLKTGGRIFVDAMDIENEKDAWAPAVKNQYRSMNLQAAGYELGDCFCRRADQPLIVFAHYSHRQEMERLFEETGFMVQSLHYLSEETGEVCTPGEGHMFYVAEKI
jgi:ubiquinone/menaquinone biosynthesis C-methylase UbiE